MTPGQRIYEAWARALARVNCGVDQWEDLPDVDKQDWEAFSEELSELFGTQLP